MDDSPDSPAKPGTTTLPKVYLREAGWGIAVKVGSERTFCYQITPGEEFYHRLQNGEVLVYRGDEKLCLPCAERRGLLTFAATPLRDRPAEMEVQIQNGDEDYDLKG